MSTRILSATSINGTKVTNANNDDLGKIEDLAVDLHDGKVNYAVISFGGFLGMGDKLFAVPWEVLTVDTSEHQILLNVDKSVLEAAPGFDKDNWPDFADAKFRDSVYTHYSVPI